MPRAVAVCLLSISGAWAEAAAHPPATISPFVAEAPAPDRERAYTAIVEKARAEYRAARSADGRTAARVSLQINVHRFMGMTHGAEDWVGVYMGGKRMDDGARSIEIQIAPDVTVATWDVAVFDRQYQTMVKPYAPLARVLDGLTIGQPVIFSADLLGSAVGSDEAMVLNPKIIAKFTALKKLDGP